MASTTFLLHNHLHNPFYPTVPTAVRKSRPWVQWTPPKHGWLKLNTDGASNTRWNRSGGGSVLRDQNRDVIFFTSFCYGFHQSPLLAEFHALFLGVRTFEKRLRDGQIPECRGLVIEMDSLLLVQMLSRVCPVSTEVEQFWKLLLDRLAKIDQQVLFSHVYREGNGVADYLAKQGVKTGHSFCGDHKNLQNADGIFKNILLLDKCRVL